MCNPAQTGGAALLGALFLCRWIVTSKLGRVLARPGAHEPDPVDAAQAIHDVLARQHATGAVGQERQELAVLRRENRRLREDVEVLKRATAFFVKETR